VNKLLVNGELFSFQSIPTKSWIKVMKKGHQEVSRTVNIHKYFWTDKDEQCCQNCGSRWIDEQG